MSAALNFMLCGLLTMNAYHITQWRLYERADTRKTHFMSWYAKQTKLVGLGIGRTMREGFPRNMTLLGTWTIIETLACGSAIQDRGWLVRDFMPLDADGMSSLVPPVPPQAFQDALDHFSRKEINWLEQVEYSPGNLPASESKKADAGTLPGESPGNLPASGDMVGGFPATDIQTYRQSTDRQTSNKETTKAASPEDSKNQTRQWCAAQSRVEAIEAISEDDRTPGDERELKRMRALLKAIQKKQAGGDFTPVEEPDK